MLNMAADALGVILMMFMSRMESAYEKISKGAEGVF
jgi:hypothetical protein